VESTVCAAIPNEEYGADIEADLDLHDSMNGARNVGVIDLGSRLFKIGCFQKQD
jgi:hypothetical protein